jgi:hypothetical protein
MANNSLTPTRPTFPRPSNTDERKSKLQQRLTLNHINPALSTSSVISLGLHGSHHKSKGFGMDNSITEEDNDNDTILQFSSLKLEKYTSTLTVPGLNVFNRLIKKQITAINEF